DTLSLINEDELNESNELNDLNTSNISENVHDLDAESGDGFDVTEVSNLINKAKTLNSYISGKNKYCKSLHELQAELNLQHQVNLLSSNTRTQWSSTYNLLKNLFLHNAIVRLANNLKQKEWHSIDELAKLLYPFIQATGYIRGSHYSTLGMMIPTLIKLSHHLREFYPTIISQTVKACCSKINQLMLLRWSEPLSYSLIAAFLDSRFKQMNYIMAIEKEVTLYDSLSQIPKYHITDEEYHKKVFSTTGNTITNKRNQLDPDTVHDLLMLKENSKIFTMYPSL
ncbi:4895_t:CDS:2, partial [Cetraspora pellucida]